MTTLATNKNFDDSLFAEVFEEVPSAIVVIDERGYVKKANKSALVLLGENVLEGRQWIEVIQAVFRPKKDDGHQISTRDGRRLQVSTKPLSHGQLVQMTDLTETRLLQDKISHMERLSSLGKMAASLAHQIRTPLSAAILYAANLANSKLPQASRNLFQKKLMSRLEDLEAQVSDILMFARSGEQTVAKVDAVDLIEKACSNVASMVAKSNVDLQTDIGSRPMPILGNQTALCGAVSNLVANAIEAGASKILVKLIATEKEIKFSVANNGPKISDEIKDRIFEPFFTSKSHGTGLGLAVVSAVAKVHQGRVILEEWEGYNTVFTITIPRYESERAPSVSLDHKEVVLKKIA